MAGGQRSKIGKWGNSLAVRIPGGIVKALGFEEDMLVEISAKGGAMRVAPSAYVSIDEIPDIDALIDSITPETLHPELISDFVGRERWWEEE